MEEILIYTDASVLVEKKHGSYAFVVLDKNNNFNIIHEEAKYLNKNFDNVYFEILAVLKALKFSKKNFPNKKIVIATDCEINVVLFNRVLKHDVNFFYKQNLRNLANEIYDLLKSPELKNITVEHVKAHKNDFFNNYVDKLCRKVLTCKEQKQNNTRLKHFNDFVEQYKKKFFLSHMNMEQIDSWFQKASNEIEFSKKCDVKFDTDKNYIGAGEVVLKKNSILFGYKKVFEEYAKKHSVLIEEKKDGRVRIHKKKYVDYLINNMNKPIIHKKISKFNATFEEAVLCATGKITEKEIYEQVLGKNIYLKEKIKEKRSNKFF